MKEGFPKEKLGGFKGESVCSVVLMEMAATAVVIQGEGSGC